MNKARLAKILLTLAFVCCTAFGISSCSFLKDALHKHNWIANTVYFSQNLEYTLSEDATYYSLTGIGSCTDDDIYIPSTYNELPVTSIGDHAFSNCWSLTSGNYWHYDENSGIVVW